MHHSKLAAREESFKRTGVANGTKYKLKPFSWETKDGKNQLDGLTVRRADGGHGYYYRAKFTKKRIVIHFTVGHIKSDIATLASKNRHVSTALVIGRDGTVYQLFNSYYWSYHLGKNAIGTNTKTSKESIGIEISNFGPLKKEGNSLKTAYNTTFCSLDDTEQYIKLDQPYRGYTYYAAFTDTQYEAIINSLRYLTAEYGIPREFVRAAIRNETTREGALLNGIVSHVNSRKDKFDIGPAFDWDRVIAGVTAETYPVSEEDLRVIELENQIATAKKALKQLEDELLIAKEEAADAAARNDSREAISVADATSSEEAYDDFDETVAARSVDDSADLGEEGDEWSDDEKAAFYTDEE